jgi:hypothetical protein
MRRTPFIALGLFVVAPLAAQEPAPAAAAGERVHVVRPGDTLWDLARLYLNDPFLWPEIFRANTGVVRDPSLIYPDERLRIPGVPGERMAAEPQVPRAEARAEAEVDEGQVYIAAEPQRAPRQELEQTVFARRETRSTEQPIHTVRPIAEEEVPALTPGVFHAAGFLMDAREVRPIARLRGKEGATVVAMQMTSQLQLRNRVYLDLEGETPRVGDRLQLVRLDRELAPHGTVFVPTGVIRIERVEGQTVVGMIDHMYDRIEIGNVALPISEFPLRSGVRARPATGVGGQIIGFEVDHPLTKPFQMVFLNVGARDGVGVGDQFEVYIPARRTAERDEPEVVVAQLQVVRVTDATATARVRSLLQPALAEGLRVRQTHRMP